MRKFDLVLQLVRYFGIRWVLFRVLYSFKMRSGFLRRVLPPYQWHERPLSYWLHEDVPSSPENYTQWRKAKAPRFFFSQLPQDQVFSDHTGAIVEANAILNGRWRYFTGHVLNIGMPPDWLQNPSTGHRVLANRHWTQISDFGAGDIKFVWEASRFSVVYTLVRAFAANKDARYPLAFWQLVDDWAKHNPPQMGPNWKCGQEASFRVMAWCFGLYAFFDHALPEKIAKLVTMIAAHGERIEKNIDYARSQNNNHGISEAVGLWTIGVLFPELSQADRWARLGREVLIAEMQRQIYEDGSYVQYSPNYQRVMLHDGIWAIRLGELNAWEFPKPVYEQVELSKNFLFAILDLGSGKVPNHGSNDSALVLPLSDADPTDFRSVIQMAHFLVKREKLFAGYDEDLWWLFGDEADKAKPASGIPPQANLSANVGGYYTLRGANSWAMIRCAEYKARPHHADQLHVDFWWQGINIFCDAGTYLYNGEPPWKNGLATTAVHNTVIVDDQDQMTPYSHFMWLNWPKGEVRYHTDNYWEGCQNGYTRLRFPVGHRRGILRLDDVWIVVDELASEAPHRYDLHWLLPQLPHSIVENSITLETDYGPFSIQCSHSLISKPSDERYVDGWRSTIYGQKCAALSVHALSFKERNTLFWTILSPATGRAEIIDDCRLMIGGKALKLGQEQLIEIEAS